MPNAILPPQRIVSLAAALTETVFAIGAGDRVVGVTDTCDYPEAARKKPNVDCWFEPNLDKLDALEPDLVIGLETAHSSLRPALEAMDIPLLLVNPTTVEESLAVMAMLGEKLGAVETSRRCIDGLRERLSRLEEKVARIPVSQRPTVSRVLDIDGGEIIVAGPKSFQYDVIEHGGGCNVSGEIAESYPKVAFERFVDWDPEVVFFCGYDRTFVDRLCADDQWRRLQAVQARRVYQFDCALTCRTGPRIVDMAELLFTTLYG
jgi:iron complex transport system substrate-binding protein